MKGRKFIGALLLPVFLMGSANAAQVRIQRLTAEESDMLIQNLQKIVIEEDIDQNIHMSIYDQIGAVISEQQINSSAKMTFEEGSVEIATSVENTQDSSSPVSFYPNPATDYIHIVGQQKDTPVLIFNLQGQLVMHVREADINVTSLAEGTYIMLVGEQCFKVIIE